MASIEDTVIRVPDILDIVLARLDNLEHQVIELKTKDQANFDALKNVLEKMSKTESVVENITEKNETVFEEITKKLNQLETNISTLKTRIDALVNNIHNDCEANYLNSQMHWIPFDIQPSSQYSARIVGEHSITGPTRVTCLPPASARRHR